MMKRLFNYLMVPALASMVLFTSCGGNDDDETVTPTTANPSITLSGDVGYTDSDVTAAAGSSLTFAWDARKNPNGKDLDVFTIERGGTDYVGVTNQGNLLPYTLPNAVQNQYVDTISITVPNSTTTYTFKVTDKDGKVASKDITVTVQNAGQINTYTATMLGAQSASTGSSYDADNNTVYTVADAKTNSDKVDFLYYYGSTDSATIAAPDDANAAQFTVFDLANWTTKNATRFAMSTKTTTEFDAMSDDTYISTISAGTATRMNDLMVGDVVEFVTGAGKKGMFKVTGINAGGTGDITISVKIQQ